MISLPPFDTPAMSDKTQYAAVANIPLIKSPSLRLPKPVELPPDIHPLPDSVTAYFVYPFTLEPHIIRLETFRRNTIAAHAARREAFLQSRADDIERRKREALRKIAPGLGTVLVPVRSATSSSNSNAGPAGSGDANIREFEGSIPPRSTMDDLVDQLEKLEARMDKRVL